MIIPGIVGSTYGGPPGGGYGGNFTLDIEAYSYNSGASVDISSYTSSTAVQIQVSLDGTKLFAFDRFNSIIKEFSFNTTATLSAGLTYTTNYFDLSSLNIGTDYSHFIVAKGGERMYVIHQSASDYILQQYNMSTAWDITTVSLATGQSYNLTTALGTEGYSDSIMMSNDGTKFYNASWDTGDMHQHSFSTSFEASTLSSDSVSFIYDYLGRVSFESISGFFGNNGTEMVINDKDAGQVLQYTLVTAFDISNVSILSNKFLDLGTEIGTTISPENSCILGDGSKFYSIDNDTAKIYEFSL